MSRDNAKKLCRWARTFRRAIKKVWGAIWERTWASVLFCGLIALFALLAIGPLGTRFSPGFLKDYNEYFTGVAAGVSAVVVALLVGATIVYARAAKQQADASMRMAEEMKEQRLSEARPYLLMRLEDLVKLEGDFNELINAEEYEMPSDFKIKIRNEGTGPAKNIIAAFWRSDDVFPFQCKGYLARQEEWQTTISTLRIDVGEIEVWLPELRKIVKYVYPGTIAIEYRDIHERRWVTYLQLQKYFLEENYIHIGEGKQSIVEIGRTSHDS